MNFVFLNRLSLCVSARLSAVYITKLGLSSIFSMTFCVQLLDTYIYIKSYSLLEIERHRNEFTLLKWTHKSSIRIIYRCGLIRWKSTKTPSMPCQWAHRIPHPINMKCVSLFASFTFLHERPNDWNGLSACEWAKWRVAIFKTLLFHWAGKIIRVKNRKQWCATQVLHIGTNRATHWIKRLAINFIKLYIRML